MYSKFKNAIHIWEGMQNIQYDSILKDTFLTPRGSVQLTHQHPQHINHLDTNSPVIPLNHCIPLRMTDPPSASSHI